MLLIALGMACTEPVADGEAFTLNIDVQLASNQTGLLSEVGRLDLIVEYATGDEVYTLDTTEPGRSAEVIGVDPLSAETISLVGYSGDEVVAFGRSTELTARKNRVDAAIVLLRTDAFAWLETPHDLAFGAAAGTGDGQFWISGGSDATTSRELSANNAALDTWWTLSLIDGLTLEVKEVDGVRLPHLGEEDHRQDVTGETAGRLAHTMTHIGDGELLITGGSPGLLDCSTTSRQAYVWSEGDDEPAPLDKMAQERAMHRVGELPSGNIVFIGGYGFTGETGTFLFNTDIDFFDISTRSFGSNTQLLSAGPNGPGVARLGDEGVLVCGGFDYGDGSLFEVKAGCDIIGLEGAVEATTPLPIGLVYPEMVTLSDGSILATGGIALPAGTPLANSSNDTLVATSRAFRFKDGIWSEVAGMNNARSLHTSALLPDGRVLVAAGASDFGGVIYFASPTVLPCAELYTPSTDSWAEVGVGSCDAESATGALPSGSWSPSIAVDDEYGVLLVGGVAGNGAAATGGALFVSSPDL